MNELRMYVEHLFEGKVLTPENIELKEEIYGNLVARYEDLVASGVTAEEALRRTKEGMTSIDDVLEQGELPAAETKVIPSAAVPESPAQPAPGAPAPPSGVTPPDGVPAASFPTTAPQRKKWPYVVGGIAAGVLAIALLLGVGNALFFGVDAPDQPSVQAQVQPGTGDVDDNLDDAMDVDDADDALDDAYDDDYDDRLKDSAVANTDDAEIVIDADGTIWYEGERAGDPVIKSVIAAKPSAVEPFVGTTLKGTNAIKKMLGVLPMGEWATNLQIGRGNGSGQARKMVTFDYAAVPERIDGDSVDAALAYNASALFCALPDADRIQVNVFESDDPYECDCYVFERTVLEDMYGMRLDGDLVSKSGWEKLKDGNLYRRDFIEHMLDRAERDLD